MRKRWWYGGLAMIGVMIALGAGTPASAQSGPASRTITVLADGEARAEPDIAIINAGVQTDGSTPREAITKANDQMQGVIDALKGMGIAAADIQTSGLNVFPITAPPDRASGGPPPVTGYQASNNVTVTIRDLSQVDAVLDGLIEAGVTNLGGLRFTVSDTAGLHQRALADAVQAARPLAQAAAQAAGLTLGDVDAIEEVSGANVPMFGGAGKGAGSVPVEPGSLSFTVTVRVTFRIA